MDELELPHNQIERLTYEPFAFVLWSSIHARPSITLLTITISPAFVCIQYANIAILVITTAFSVLISPPSASSQRPLPHNLHTTSAHVHIDFFTPASV
jgi:hypothetical protein